MKILWISNNGSKWNFTIGIVLFSKSGVPGQGRACAHSFLCSFLPLQRLPSRGAWQQLLHLAQDLPLDQAGIWLDSEGHISLCIWGISPTIFVSLPQQNCFISPTTWVTSPTTCVTSPTHFLISPTTLCHFAPRQKILFFFKFYLFFISQHPCIILTKAKPFLRI